MVSISHISTIKQYLRPIEKTVKQHQTEQYHVKFKQKIQYSNSIQ